MSMSYDLNKRYFEIEYWRYSHAGFMMSAKEYLNYKHV